MTTQNEAVALAPAVPNYLKEIYHWAYLHPRNVSWLDQEWIVNLILWGNARKLRSAFLNEIAAGASVLHAAHVYGVFVKELLATITPAGQLDLFDIAPIQLRRCQRKLGDHPNVNLWLADVKQPLLHHPKPTVVEYDICSAFFLLHELPDERKYEAVETLLTQVKPGGKALFVDYHRPVDHHPLKPIISKIFDWFEPFAKSLWQREIADYGRELHAEFKWKKETFFGGLYQKVVAERLRR